MSNALESISISPDSQDITVWLFLGVAQTAQLARLVAKRCPSGVAVVPGAPYWKTAEDGSEIQSFSYEYTHEMITSLYAKFGAPASIMAESQAAPGILMCLARDQLDFSRSAVLLLQPLGLNAYSYKGVPDVFVEFKRRVAQNSKYQITSFLSDPFLLYNHATLAKYTPLHALKTKQQFSHGLTYNARPELEAAKQRCRQVSIVMGEQDKLFPPEEIARGLTNGVQTVIIPGIPHMPLTTRKGRALLRRAFSIAREK